MRRRSFLSMAAIVVASATWTPVAAASELSVIADEWPPFSGAALANNGIALDVTTSVLRRAGYDATAQIVPWARIMENVRAGRVDVVTSLFYDDDVASAMTYSEPFMSTEIRLVRRVGGDASYRTLDDLRPYAIAVGAGFLYEAEFDAAAYLRKIEVTTTLQALRMVAAGRVDVTLDSAHVVDHAMSVEDPALLGAVEYFGEPLATQQVYMAVSRTRPDHAAVVEAFNAALEEMRADGSLAALIAGHATN